MVENPRNLEQAAKIIVDAYQSRTKLALCGSNSKPGWPHVAKANRIVSSKSLSGIIAYEPEELLLTIQAGTGLEEVQQLLTGKGQALPFDPPNYAAHFRTKNAGTIGGIVSTNLSGPKRFSKGPARDYVLAIKGVNGQGEIFNAGAKVVKNVTGYDLPKLLTGSFGTLAFLGEITLKVLPAPPRHRTLIFQTVEISEADSLLRLARQTDKEVAACCYLPATNEVALLLEGGALADRAQYIMQAAGSEARLLTEEEGTHFWQSIADLNALAGSPVIARMAVPPAAGMTAYARLKMALPHARFVIDWGGALINIGLPDVSPELFIIANAAGGHVRFLTRPSADSSLVEPPSLPLAIMKKIKAAFDPAFILNPGKLHPDL